jgi:hypothetical protein
MKLVRLLVCTGALGAVALLSGCVVAPIGPRAYAYGPGYGQPVVVAPAGAVYAAPAPVVVVPQVQLGIGYYGRGYYGGGYRRWH